LHSHGASHAIHLGVVDDSLRVKSKKDTINHKIDRQTNIFRHLSAAFSRKTSIVKKGRTTLTLGGSSPHRSRMGSCPVEAGWEAAQPAASCGSHFQRRLTKKGSPDISGEIRTRHRMRHTSQKAIRHLSMGLSVRLLGHLQPSSKKRRVCTFLQRIVTRPKLKEIWK
jgi:hypothetical protein